MVQGFDRQHKEFTAFVLCDKAQSEAIENAKIGAGSFDLNELNIIYTLAGHDIDAKTQHDVEEYYQNMVGEVTN